MPYLVSGAATKLSYDFVGDALQVATSVNGLSNPVTANRGGNGAGLCFGEGVLQEVFAVTGLSIPMTVCSSSAPSYSIAEDVTEGGSVNNRI